MPPEETGVNEVSSPGTEDTTKIIAARIKAAREQDRSELAAALGFNSWEDALNSGMSKKLLDAGIDPDAATPIINGLVAEHPDVIRAREVIKEAEKRQRDAELTVLNMKYGLKYESVDDLDEQTKSLISKGLTLEQAYAASHADSLFHAGSQVSQQDVTLTAKSHVTPLPGSSAGAVGAAVSVSQSDIDNVRRYLPGASLEQIQKFLMAHPELKRG